MRIRVRGNKLDSNVYPFAIKYAGLLADLTERIALESTAQRMQVGALIVTPSGGFYTGYNGTISGEDNVCEVDNVTKNGVYHAEENALDRMHKDGVSPNGGSIYLTLTPCINCAKRILGAGIKYVFYRDEYRDLSGVEFLRKNGVVCHTWDELMGEENDS